MSGIAVSPAASDIYAVNVDTVGQGSVVAIQGVAASAFTAGLHIGNPGGAALSLDSSKLVVSARDAASGTSAVLVFTIATKGMTAITDVISAYNEPAGIHRAHKADVFAFVDNRAKGTGAVFVLR